MVDIEYDPESGVGFDLAYGRCSGYSRTAEYFGLIVRHQQSTYSMDNICS